MRSILNFMYMILLKFFKSKNSLLRENVATIEPDFLIDASAWQPMHAVATI